VNLTAQWQVIALDDAAREKIGRSDGAKRPKVVDKMGLVIITISRRGARPVHVAMGRQRIHRSLETTDALKEFWCQANLLVKNATETPLTEPDLFQQGGNGKK
jgi:hypothetical protein